MAVKKGSKNNIANRGAAARIKTYGGKPVKPVMMYNGNTKFIAAKYEDNKPVVGPDGQFVEYNKIQ
jgi:hypothetical protein